MAESGYWDDCSVCRGGRKKIKECPCGGTSYEFYQIIENKEYQPYFQAYILHHDLQVGDGVPNHDYMIWNQRKWRTFKRINDIPDDCPVSDEEEKQFENWLFSTAPVKQLNLF